MPIATPATYYSKHMETIALLRKNKKWLIAQHLFSPGGDGNPRAW